MIRWILGMFAIGVLFLFPELAFADNCSSPADCWGTAAGGAATAGGIAGLIAGSGGFWKWYRYKDSVGWVYKKGHGPGPDFIGPPPQRSHGLGEMEWTEDRSRWVPGTQVQDRFDPLMKWYLRYKWLSERIGGAETKSSIAASGKA